MIFQNEKTPCYTIKKKSTKNRKIDIFPKGLTHRLRPKMAIFPTYFLGNLSKENVFYDIIERKNAFLGYKSKSLKSQKNSRFSKGVNAWFWSKNGQLSTFFFQAIQATKISFMIFQNEKTPLKKQEIEKVEKFDNFQKRISHGLGPKMVFIA